VLTDERFYTFLASVLRYNNPIGNKNLYSTTLTGGIMVFNENDIRDLNLRM
ncbi:hypothetical protein THOM_3133, partial [Trachipleistophora hominis]